jgi:hypothetical protein
MYLKGSEPQFSKLGPATEMALQVDSSNFFPLIKCQVRWQIVWWSNPYHLLFGASQDP